MMRVVDPIANVERDFEACHTLDAIGAYVPVESLFENEWFVVYMPTGASRSINDIPPESQHEVYTAIDTLSVQAEGVLAMADLIESFVKIEEAGEPVSPLVESFATVDEGLSDKHILKAIFVLGAGGAGKGAVTKAAFAGSGLKIINADTHFERFLKAAKVPLKDAGKEYALFDKARDLRDKELRHYAGRRLGIILDMTGWAYDRVASPVKKLRDLGYDVYAVFVDTRLDTALKRNKARADAGGREVPDSYVKDAWYGSQRHAGDYVKLFGLRNFFRVDNEKDLKPQIWDKVVGQRVRKIGHTILTRKLFNPKGKEWIEKQLDPKTADVNDPKAPNPWPAPEPFKPPKGEYKAGSLASKYTSLTPGKAPKQKKQKPPKFSNQPKMGKQDDGTIVWPGAPKPKKPKE